jgi:hypothetical protein
MKKIVGIVLLLVLTFTVDAQSFEIRATNKGNGIIAVELRAVASLVPSTSNYLTDLVFGLKWLSSYNIDLVPSINTPFKIKKSDVRKAKSAYHY